MSREGGKGRTLDKRDALSRGPVWIEVNLSKMKDRTENVKYGDIEHWLRDTSEALESGNKRFVGRPARRNEVLGALGSVTKCGQILDTIFVEGLLSEEDIIEDIIENFEVGLSL